MHRLVLAALLGTALLAGCGGLDDDGCDCTIDMDPLRLVQARKPDRATGRSRYCWKKWLIFG